MTPSSPKGSVASEVDVLSYEVGQLTGGDTELFGGRPSDEVPPVEDLVDRQVGEESKRERHRQRPVRLVGRLADVEEVGQAAILVAEEPERRTESSLERFEDPGRIDGDDGDALISDVCGF
ncbi:MAG: hypothetical protein OEV40_06455 [Acidimicrobiia bacterium]|nr:hypothetical protein [Acidimicrobiia bacterium]